MSNGFIDMLMLETKVRSIKLRFLGMYQVANAGHVGSALSCAEILTFIKFALMKPQDDLILSKGHAAAALYSLLAESGAIEEAEIETFYKDGTRLSAHPPVRQIPEIPFATGSLGHGLSLAAGIALAYRLREQTNQVYCVASDGELNEGSTWEALLFGAQQQLGNLNLFIDRNRLQGFGETERTMRLEPLAEKLKSFGWAVDEVNGHEFSAMAEASERMGAYASRPKAIICQTVKGKGMGNLEDTVDCHYRPLTSEIYDQMISQLSKEKTHA